MPSITKLAITSLALLAHSATAAPILNGVLGGSGSGTGSLTADLKAKVGAIVNLGGSKSDGLLLGGKSDLKVFADTFVRTFSLGYGVDPS